jgi:hypothetical protein
MDPTLFSQISNVANFYHWVVHRTNCYGHDVWYPHDLLGFIFCWFIYFIIKILRFGSREKYLPPGPSTWPIIGNANLMLGRNLGKWRIQITSLGFNE